MLEEQRNERREVLYSGTVQGVGFRYTARRIAARFAVTGYVRNLTDGRVRLVAEGSPAELNRFLAEVRDEFGPLIDDVETVTSPASGEFSRFDIRH